jgi:hypothetical protein
MAAQHLQQVLAHLIFWKLSLVGNIGLNKYNIVIIAFHFLYQIHPCLKRIGN